MSLDIYQDKIVAWCDLCTPTKLEIATTDREEVLSELRRQGWSVTKEITPYQIARERILCPACSSRDGEG